MVPTVAPTENSDAPGFDVQGHRGARGLKPENTLPAFETALDLGVTTLELDLHFTSDHVVIVWHDPEIDNAKCRLDPEATVDAPEPDSLVWQGDKLRLSNLTFAQVQAYICDRNPDPDRFPSQDNNPTPLAGSNYRIVSLAQLFDFVTEYTQSEEKTASQRANAGHVHFNVETKRRPDDPRAINDDFDGVNPGPFEQAILALIEERGLLDRVIVQSFDHRSLWAIRAVNDTIRLAALTPRGAAVSLPDLAASGANIWSSDYADVTLDRLAEAHAANLLVIPWTVNEPDEMHRLIDMGVDGLITDRPDLLLSLSAE
ncbi:MAG TPA: glycerophosphodiester phosphodiesterase family protein [Anaerolineae bacterium]